MNKQRRELLKSAVFHLERASDIISEALDEESDCMDNMPENLQETERYSTMENAVDCMEDAISCLDDAIDKINSATG